MYCAYHNKAKSLFVNLWMLSLNVGPQPVRIVKCPWTVRAGKFSELQTGLPLASIPVEPVEHLLTDIT